jgi:hypothetical protein
LPISLFKYSSLSSYLWHLWLSGCDNPLFPWLLGVVSLTDPHSLVISSGTPIIFPILLIEVSLTMS